ncbi:hypothetical protein [Helicobacter mustelae]|nr:hypothetical protein [Helicobacter mustelae]
MQEDKKRHRIKNVPANPFILAQSKPLRRENFGELSNNPANLTEICK